MVPEASVRQEGVFVQRALTTSVAVVGVLVFCSLMALSLIAFDAIVDGRVASFAGLSQPDSQQVGGVDSAVSGIFGTIQFAVAVLSGLIIVFAAILTFIVGRSARQAQEAAREEIASIAILYKENIQVASQSLAISARHAVDEYLQEDDLRETLEKYKSTMRELEEDRAAIGPIIEDFRKFQTAVQELEPDYSALFQELVREEELAAEIAQQGGQPRSASTLAFAEERTRWQRALLQLERGALQRKIDSEMAFNGAQNAALRLFNELSHRLAVVAAWLDPSELYKLRVLRSEQQRGDRLRVVGSNGRFYVESVNPSNDAEVAQRIREEAFQTAIRYLPQLPLFNYHLVLAEIWNISLSRERFQELIAALEEYIDGADRSGKYVPSYAHLQVAQAETIMSREGWRERALAQMRVAQEKLASESPRATWFTTSMRELTRLMALLDIQFPPTSGDQGGLKGMQH